MSDQTNGIQPTINSTTSMAPNSQTNGMLPENGKIANNSLASSNKQKIIKIKEGQILRYKSKSHCSSDLLGPVDLNLV